MWTLVGAEFGHASSEFFVNATMWQSKYHAWLSISSNISAVLVDLVYSEQAVVRFFRSRTVSCVSGEVSQPPETSLQSYHCRRGATHTAVTHARVL